MKDANPSTTTTDSGGDEQDATTNNGQRSSSASFEIDVDALMEAREGAATSDEPDQVVQRTNIHDASSSSTEVIVPSSRRKSKSRVLCNTTTAPFLSEHTQTVQRSQECSSRDEEEKTEEGATNQHQQQVDASTASAASGVASAAATTAASDHQAALALARQDLQEKGAEGGGAIEDQRRKAGEPPMASSNLARASPARPPVPVGAFRINPSESGRYAIQSAADAVVESTNTNSTNTDRPPSILESDMVLESTLVTDQDRSSRRRSRARRLTEESATITIIDEETPVQEESAPVPSSSPPNDVMIITAETPTLIDSLWTLLKSRKGRWGIFIVIALVATLPVLGVTVWKRQNQPKQPHTVTSTPLAPTPLAPLESMAPSTAPTFMPTSAPPTAAPTIRQFALQDLPATTTALILPNNNNNSPQAKAWRWLQNDPQLLLLEKDATVSSSQTKLSHAEQVLQRFVLATLYHATNGPGWQFQQYWIHAETTECNWWPHVTSATWPYDVGDAVCNLQGEYTRILLRGNSLQGTLPPEVALLPHLTRVDLSHNPGLTGAIPQELCERVADDSDPLEVWISCGASLMCDCGCQCV